jgi:hypothetical protein
MKLEPGKKDSATYEVEVKLFSSGTPEEWLEFLDVWEKVKNGQQLTTDTAQATVFANMLQGEALRVFEVRKTQVTLDATTRNFDALVQEVTRYFFPEQALVDQKRFLCHYNRKNASTPVCEYVSRLQDINQKLNQFPPFGANQAMSEDDLIEILEFSMPHAWNVEMRERGFTPHTKTLQEVVEFYERSEILEKLRGVNFVPNSTKRDNQQNHGKSEPGKVRTDSDKSSKKGSKWNASKSKTSSDTKYCPLHNTNGHNLGKCKVMQEQAKKMRANWETKRPKSDQKRSAEKAVSSKGESNNIESETKPKNTKRKRDDRSTVINDYSFKSDALSTDSEDE